MIALGTEGPGTAAAEAPAHWPQALDLPALVARVSALPALPEAVTEVLKALQTGSLSTQHCVTLIERDPALTAATLRLANSAFYGVPGRVGSIGAALRLLGLRTVSGVLATSAMHGAIRVDSCPSFSLRHHWQHAISGALCARALAPCTGHDPDEAYLAGLLHDVGQLALAAFEPLAADATIRLARAQHLDAETAERAVLGVSHARVGALLAERWHFPPDIVRAIAHHHAPEPSRDGHALSLSALVHAADAISHALSLSDDPARALPYISGATWKGLALERETALRLFTSVARDARELGELLHGS